MQEGRTLRNEYDPRSVEVRIGYIEQNHDKRPSFFAVTTLGMNALQPFKVGNLYGRELSEVRRIAYITEYAWQASLEDTDADPEATATLDPLLPLLPAILKDWYQANNHTINRMVKRADPRYPSELEDMRTDTPELNNLPWLQHLQQLRGRHIMYGDSFDRAECGIRLMLTQAREDYELQEKIHDFPAPAEYPVKNQIEIAAVDDSAA